MTYEEAIERIKKLHCWGAGNECAYHFDKRGKCYSCEIRWAIESMEKQIPKKPHNVEDKYWACPNCQDLLMVKWVTYPTNPVPLEAGRAYCECCGQAIDWSEE